MKEFRKLIEPTIQALADDYRRAPGLILTEDDLKFHLVSRLLQLPGMSDTVATVDGVLGTKIHTEVPWFDEHGKLYIRPDITILDPGQLSIFHSIQEGYRLPNKGFNFEGGSIIFELKFIRERAGVTKECASHVQRDLDKIRRLFDRIERDEGGDDLFCYFVIFSKVGAKVPEFDRLLANGAPNDRCRVIYETANVQWP